MTYTDVSLPPSRPAISWLNLDRINRFFSGFGSNGVADSIEGAARTTQPVLSAREENLRDVQTRISGISMHLPVGFVPGLNRQFANLMDDDAWEDDDEFIASKSIQAFTEFLIETKSQRRPGVGTDGRGSITVSWSVGKNRLIAECLPSGMVSMVLSRVWKDGEVERAAFGPMTPKRANEKLAPFDPEVWFDG